MSGSRLEQWVSGLLNRLDGRWTVAIALALGLVFRVAQYLANRSLWLDEVLLARNIINRPFADFWLPLGDDQGAPIGFLFLEQLAVELWGAEEFALRLFPLLAGVASVFLFYLVAQAFLDRWALAFAVALFSAAEPLIYFSSEVKQYSSDVLLALIISYAFCRAHRLGATRSNLLILAGVGMLAVWFSDPAVFALTGGGAYLAFLLARRRENNAAWLVGVFLVWTLSFAMNYVLRLGNLAGNATLQAYWQDYFMPLSVGAARWLTRTMSGTLGFFFPNISKLVIGLTLAIGLWVSRRNRLTGLLVAPFVFALIASGLRYYPFYDRFLLFGLPSLIILCAAGVEFIVRELSVTRMGGLFSLALAGLVLWQPGVDAFAALAQPRTHEEIRPVIQYLLQHREKSDGLYVYYSAAKPLEYYLGQFQTTVPYTVGIKSRDRWMRYLDDLSKWHGTGRVWFLFSHVLRSEGVDEEELFIQYLSDIGRQLAVFQRNGASVYLFEFK